MSANPKEYVFCPFCGGITPPGVCVNCGMSTNANMQGINGQNENGIVQENDNQNPGVQLGSQDGMYNSYTYQQNNQDMYQQYGYSNMNQQGTQGQNMYQQSVDYASNAVPVKEKKSKWWIWLLIIGFLLVIGVLLIAIVIVGGLFVIPLIVGMNTVTTQSVTTLPSNPTPVVSESPDYGTGTGGGSVVDNDVYANVSVYERQLGRLDFSNFDWDSYKQNALHYSESTDGSNDLFLQSGYTSTFGSNHDNHSADEFTGEYYEPFVDCIDISQNYGLSRHFIEYSNVQDSTVVNAYIAYIQLQGNTIPNEDALNQQILDMTANDLFAHITGKNVDYTYYQSVTYMVDSFVTYNDGEKMSILLDANVMINDSTFAESYIYGINIDLVNGVILDNASIIEADEDFAAMFREKCCTQNGSDIVALNSIDDNTLAQFLAHSNTNIIFYSPYGIEVGYAYESVEGDTSSRGWATITLKDYEQYLKK